MGYYGFLAWGIKNVPSRVKLFIDIVLIYIVVNNIRIYHECEGRIEKSDPRITVWRHEACRVMTNGDLEGRIFLSYPYTKIGFFFAHQCFFNFKISFQKSLDTLRCNFT